MITQGLSALWTCQVYAQMSGCQPRDLKPQGNDFSGVFSLGWCMLSCMWLRVSIWIVSFDYILASSLFFWVASSSLGYQGGGDESASIPQSFCFSLILCSVFWIYQIWKKVSCAYDPSPFSLPLEVWVRCRGYAQTLIKQTVCDFLHMGSHTCKHGFGQSRHYSTTLDSCPVPLLRFATFQVTTTLTSSISVVDSLMFSRLFLFWQLISLLPWPEGEGSILWVLFNKCPLSCSVF